MGSVRYHIKVSVARKGTFKHKERYAFNFDFFLMHRSYLTAEHIALSSFSLLPHPLLYFPHYLKSFLYKT